MEIKGKIISVLPISTGSGKNGEWKSQDAVLETSGQYPKKVAFNMFNDKIQELNIGDEVTVSFEVESREYSGRWYTTVRAWKIEKGSACAPVQNQSAPVEQQPEPKKEDTLPF